MKRMFLLILFCTPVLIFANFFDTGKWELVKSDQTRIKYDEETDQNIVVIEGNVEIKNGKNTYKADTILFFEKKEEIRLLGNVEVFVNQIKVTALVCEYDMPKGRAYFYGNVVMQKDDFYLESPKVWFWVYTNVLEAIDEVYFKDKEYAGLATRVRYDDKNKKIQLDGFPYLKLYGTHYIGGDVIDITYDSVDPGFIHSVVVTGHADFFYKTDDTDLYINSDVLTFSFKAKDTLQQIVAKENVRYHSITSGTNTAQNINSDILTVLFAGNNHIETTTFSTRIGKIRGEKHDNNPQEKNMKILPKWNFLKKK